MPTYEFTADFKAEWISPARVYVFPAHPTNFSLADDPNSSYQGKRNAPKFIFWHTPEEAADGVEGTPQYFARDLSSENRRASTHYYADNDGDLYQMVRDIDCAFAQGVTSARRHYKGKVGEWIPGSIVGLSYNCQGLSIEIEGFGASIGKTLTAAQRKTVVEWTARKCIQYGIPADRDHILRHSEVDTWKVDPGTLPVDEMVREVAARVIELNGGTPGAQKTYRAVFGDTLGSIAKKFGVTVDQLVLWNSIPNPNVISVGQQIKVTAPVASWSPPPPSWETPVAKPLSEDEYIDALITGVWGGQVGTGTGTSGKFPRPTNRVENGFEVHEILVKRNK